eukprot:CAMPEP_0181498280 /NCGR_PEP_ID=MMETSP1110-20121109/54018_1 /TAXON_ID=174948 /ORGANISM="Symbiodinium sp., Strain CCMP421" /LENGTH=64 /DNA_ID=CAMNT_0023626343 /DNA_START=87 /DNA_END=277 /DNA_ORIENTATION=-
MRKTKAQHASLSAPGAGWGEETGVGLWRARNCVAHSLAARLASNVHSKARSLQSGMGIADQEST